MSEREHLIRTLARQVLHTREPDGEAPRVTPGVTNAGHATVNVEIRGMVDTIRRQIWVDHGAITEQIVAEIEEQASKVDLQAEIRRAVEGEIRRAIEDLGRTVRKRIEAMVESEITTHIGRIPAAIARKFADKLWREAFL